MRLIACLIALLVIAQAAPGDRIVDPAAPYFTEFMPNPEGADRGAEWVEIYNPAPLPLDLDGWRIIDHNGRSHSLQGQAIAPLGFLVVQFPGTAFRGVQLPNAGGSLSLVDPDGHAWDYAAYGTLGLSDGPGAPDEGVSLAREIVSLVHHERPRGAWYMEDEPSPGTFNDPRA